MAPHLPKAGLFTPNAVRETPVLKSGGVHHLAVGAGMLLEPACLSGRWCQAGSAVEDRAAQGGADGCAQVRLPCVRFYGCSRGCGVGSRGHRPHRASLNERRLRTSYIFSADFFFLRINRSRKSDVFEIFS